MEVFQMIAIPGQSLIVRCHVADHLDSCDPAVTVHTGQRAHARGLSFSRY